LTKYHWLSIFCFLTFIAHAQIEQVARYEVPGEDKITYSIQPCGENGLVLWNLRDIQGQTDSLLLSISALDTALNYQWERKFLLSSKRQFIAQTNHDQKAYFLFASNDLKDRDLQLIEINSRTGFTRVHIIKNIIPFSFFNMKVTGNAVILAGYFNYRPFVLLFDFDERIPRVLPGLFSDKTEIVQIKVNQNETIDIILKGKNFDKNTTLYIYTFSKKANLLKTIELQVADKNKSLLFGRLKSLKGPAELIAGTYGRKNSEYSRGIFIANVNQIGQQNIKYYNYAEFENFFNYMKAKREARIKRRIERKRIKNKKIRFNYRLNVHKIFKHKDQYILLGEAFYPQYRTISGGNNNLFAPTWTVNRGMFSYSRVFDGYRYTHAVVIGFNQQGKVLWDNSFEIKDVLSKQLDQYVHASIQEDRINLLYVFDGAIRSKVIRGNEVIEGKEIIDIQTKYSNDSAAQEDTEVTGLQTWYGSNFITYGYQRIKNLTTAGVNLNRNVFFINKLSSKVE